jgi:pantoate--beta-alanine ligase
VTATTPIIVDAVDAMRAACDAARGRGERVALVPTMGALHDGHLALVRAARDAGDAGHHGRFVAASIFVNPTQFGPNEDYARYPRDLDGDVKKLATAGCDLIFAPVADAMYPAGEQTRVRVGKLAEPLCGAFRPGHFEGVATVVTKLLAIAGPCVAVFGKKDYQQLAILRRVATDLFLPVEIVGHPIVREADGLAMSSRNAYLAPEERARALALSRGLAAAARAFQGGERRASILRRAAREPVDAAATSVDYVDLADADTLTVVDDGGLSPDRVLLAIACRIGKTRLIDNVVLGEDPAPVTGASGVT